MTLLLRIFRETFVVGLFSWRPRVLIARLCVLSSASVATLYFAAGVAYAVLPGSPYDLNESVAIAVFAGTLAVGALVGGGAIVRAESADEGRGRFGLAGLAIFLVTLAFGSLAGMLFMVLVPLVFIPSAIVLTIIVVSGRRSISVPKA